MFFRRKIKAFLQNGAVFLVSLSISFVAAEAGYRIYLYKVITDQLVKSVEAHLNPATGLWQFDAEIGLHYKPNSSWVDIAASKDDVRINQFGFVANDLDPEPYTVAKPQGEYRIAVLGDSFTAGLQNYIRWPDFVQGHLNRSPQWRARVGGKFTRVLNFGIAGTGFAQWAKVYQFRARQFEPDLVLVSFVTYDIPRRFLYGGIVTDLRDSDHAAISEFLKKHLLNELPWFGLHSEIIAAVGNLFTTTDRRLTAAAAYQKYTSYADRPTAIKESVSALEQISCMNANTIFLQDPLIDEMQVREDTLKRYPYDNPAQPLWTGLESEFLAAATAHHLDIIQLLDRNPLPPDHSRMHALYNEPIDTHHSDYGALLYARWVSRYLLSWSASHSVEPVMARFCAEQS
ncbi:MAG TPA: SGNH/GDSL hydrolase family protein [Pseudolabrys sp.]